VSLSGPADRPLPVAIRLQNTSDRLSEPVAEGLEGPRFRREGQLALEFTGVLPPGGRGRIALRPRPLPPGWQFAVGGDVKEQLGIFMAVVEAVRLEHDPLFLLAVGDYTRNSLPGELEQYFARTASIPFPIYPIKGNHETNCQGRRHYPRWFGPDRYSFRVGEVFFAVLDSTRWDGRGYHLGAEQLAWLEGELGRNAGAPWKVVGLHVPPHPMHTSLAGYPGNLVEPDAARLQELAAAHAVTFVISGHVHLHARMEQAGTVYLTSAGGGSRLDGHEPVPGMQYQLGPHLTVLTVRPGAIEETRVAPARLPPEVAR
jgi:3',5'-cyclic AMP phosphodiesterase CpdA